MGVTVAIERWGGIIGGVLGTVPSTIVPAALGIHSTAADDAAFVAAMYAAPAGMVLNVSFLWLWRVLPARLPQTTLGRRLALMATISLAAWFAAATVVILAVGGMRGLGVSMVLVGVVASTLMLSIGLIAARRAMPAPSGQQRVGPATLLGRGLLAATAIGLAVVLAHSGGELAAGVAAVFPAIFFTSMVALWLAQGESVPAGAVGPMMLGSTSVAAYCLVIAFTLPAWGPWLGSLAAWCAAVLVVSVPTVNWLQRRQRERVSSQLELRGACTSVEERPEQDHATTAHVDRLFLHEVPHVAHLLDLQRPHELAVADVHTQLDAAVREEALVALQLGLAPTCRSVMMNVNTPPRRR